MCASNSSGVRRPVISSNAARASCRSASTNSSGIAPAVGQRRRARSLQRLVRALDERDVTHVRDLRTLALRIRVEHTSPAAARNCERPSPVRGGHRDHAGDGAAGRRRRDVDLVPARSSLLVVTWLRECRRRRSRGRSHPPRQRLSRSLDAFDLRRIGRFAQTPRCRRASIEGRRDPASSVTRSRVVPGTIRHDGAVGAEQRIEEARFPDVRACRRWRPVILRESRRPRRAPASSARVCARRSSSAPRQRAGLDEVISLVWKIDGRFEACDEIEQAPHRCRQSRA